MSKEIHENNKSYFYSTEINRHTVEVTFSLGWIVIRENEGHTGPFGLLGKEQFKVTSMTARDARKLVEAIQRLLPEEDK